MRKKLLNIFLICLLCFMGQARCDYTHGVIGAVLGIGGTVATKVVYDKFFVQERPEEENEFVNLYLSDPQDVRFSDFVGYDDIVEKLKSFVEPDSRFNRYMDEGIPRYKGLVFIGDKSSGKSLLTNIMASELGAKIIYVSNEFIFYNGEEGVDGQLGSLLNSAKNVSQNDKIVVCFEDFEQLIADPHVRDLLRTFCSSIENDQNILITCEMAYDAESEIFEEAYFWDLGLDTVHIDLPNLNGRKSILMHCVNNYKLDPNTDWDFVFDGLSRRMFGCSFVIIKDFVDEVGRISVRDNSNLVKEEHFEEALWRLSVGSRSDVVQTEEDLWMSALHEAGHALIASKSGRGVYGMSIVPSRMALGVVSLTEDEVLGNRKKVDLMHDIMISFGGPCAEVMFENSGNITVGSSQDIDNASRTASAMVSSFGMGGGDYSMITDLYLGSDKMKEYFDRSAIAILQKCRKATKVLLGRYRGVHLELAKLLLEKEQLSKEDVLAVIGEPVDEATRLLVA